MKTGLSKHDTKRHPSLLLNLDSESPILEIPIESEEGPFQAALQDFGSHYFLLLEGPELKDHELELEFHKNVLRVQSRKSHSSRRRQKSALRPNGDHLQMLSENFERIFVLPEDIEATESTAAQQDNLIYLLIPKRISN